MLRVQVIESHLCEVDGDDSEAEGFRFYWPETGKTYTAEACSEHWGAIYEALAPFVESAPPNTAERGDKLAPTNEFNWPDVTLPPAHIWWATKSSSSSIVNHITVGTVRKGPDDGAGSRCGRVDPARWFSAPDGAKMFCKKCMAGLKTAEAQRDPR
jgi:hypothetical protein